MSRKPALAGMHVIPWSNTEIDHEPNGPLSHLAVGAAWRWWGEATRVDGPSGLVTLHCGEHAQLRQRAARRIGVGGSGSGHAAAIDDSHEPLCADCGFVLTDGYGAYPATLLAGGKLVLFDAGLPPKDTQMWVVRLVGSPLAADTSAREGVICFTAGTRIGAPGGARPVEALRPGERIFTRDDGPCEVIWTGHCRLSPQQLRQRPELRPIRLRAGALGAGRPDRDLLVSPDHRILLRGAAARRLYHAPEVLVRAADLLDDRRITVDRTLRGVTYIHVMLARHQIVWANGLATDSFHPAHTDPEGLEPSQRGALYRAFPPLADGVERYGEAARRCLDTAEAEILRHAIGWGH